MLQTDKEEEIHGQVMLPPSREETKKGRGDWSLHLIFVTCKINSAFEVGSLFSIALLGLC